LQDFLELPILAAVCVRGGHFQEALDLTTHAARLATRFPHVQVVRDVHAKANGAISTLLGQLLATLRAPGKLPSLLRAVSFLRRIHVSPEQELALAFLMGRLEALNVGLTSAEGEKRGLDAPDAWVRYMKKYIDTWREGVHDLLTQYVAIFLERPPADLSPEDLHTLRSLLPACTAQLLSRLLDALRSALPQFPDAPALMALLSQLTYCATRFDLCTPLGTRMRVWWILQADGQGRAYAGDGAARCCWSTAWGFGDNSWCAPYAPTGASLLSSYCDACRRAPRSIR
jgi:hypothetical protein